MPLTCPPSCKNQKTIFYWDAENAPIPYEMEPDDLLTMFRSSLIRFGYNGVFEIKVFVGGYRQNHRNSRMSLQDKETMEKHGIPLFYEEDDAADFALLRVLKQDDRHSNYKNNVVIIGGDHRHVKHLQFCQDRHKRNVMLLYTQALKRSLENVLKKQLSLRDFLELPAPSKEDKQQYDRAKRIASGQMDPYRDGQRAKKWRKEQRRKARNAEELQALGINEYVVLNEEKLVKENPKKNKNKKANKGFNEEKKHKMEENEEEEMKRKGSCKGKRGRGVAREQKKHKNKMEEDEEEEMKRKGSCKGKRERGVAREEKKQKKHKNKMKEDEEEEMKRKGSCKGKRGRGVAREEKKHKMEEDEEDEMKRKGSCKGKRGRGVAREEKKQKKNKKKKST